MHKTVIARWRPLGVGRREVTSGNVVNLIKALRLTNDVIKKF